MPATKKLLSKLIEYSEGFGLRNEDLLNAKSFLSNNELGLCFDTIITQMYEYNIKVNEDYFNLAKEIGNKMEISEKEYYFISELVKIQ